MTPQELLHFLSSKWHEKKAKYENSATAYVHFSLDDIIILFGEDMYNEGKKVLQEENDTLRKGMLQMNEHIDQLEEEKDELLKAAKEIYSMDGFRDFLFDSERQRLETVISKVEGGNK